MIVQLVMIKVLIICTVVKFCIYIKEKEIAPSAYSYPSALEGQEFVCLPL